MRKKLLYSKYGKSKEPQTTKVTTLMIIRMAKKFRDSGIFSKVLQGMGQHLKLLSSWWLFMNLIKSSLLQCFIMICRDGIHIKDLWKKGKSNTKIQISTNNLSKTKIQMMWERRDKHQDVKNLQWKSIVQ